MRGLIALAALITLAATPAAAQPFTDYTARLALELPDQWTVAPTAMTRMPYVRASSGTNECHFIVVARPATQDAEPYRVRLAGRELLAEPVWARMPPALPRVFAPDATVQTTRVDETPFWPIQFGVYTSAGRPVHAAVQFRPGAEYWGFCLAREGEDSAATFEQILRSVGSTDDAALRAAAEATELAQASSEEANQRAFRGFRDQLASQRGQMSDNATGGNMGSGSGPPGGYAPN
jgi:hypothetical protein